MANLAKHYYLHSESRPNSSLRRALSSPARTEEAPMEVSSVLIFFYETCLDMYFINKKAKYNTVMAKEELTRVKHMTKSRKQKRRANRDRLR
jgi:hypothetical protein